MIQEYWNNQWRVVTENPIQEEHSQSIPNDFLVNITKPRQVLEVIKNAKSILDFGSGTGHMCHVVSLLSRAIVLGSEISEVAVNYANKKYGNGRVSFVLKDMIGGIPDPYDLIISSNTLEHFKNPFPVIDYLLSKCKHLIVLVPNKGTFSENNAGDGGDGHRFSFSVGSFKDYNVIEAFTFYSWGWTEEPNPLQLCVLIKGEL